MAPWSGVVLSSARLSPKDDIDFELVRMNAVPTVVRKLDERTIEYSTDPSTIRVKLAYSDDPWVRSVDPRLYQRWVQELGTEPVSFLICSGQFSHLPEYLLMWLAWRMQVRHPESRVEAWDFPTSQFAPVEFIDWSHVIAVVEGREARYGPDNPRPEDRPDLGYDDLYPAKKRRFWRRGLFSATPLGGYIPGILAHDHSPAGGAQPVTSRESVST